MCTKRDESLLLPASVLLQLPQSGGFQDGLLLGTHGSMLLVTAHQLLLTKLIHSRSPCNQCACLMVLHVGAIQAVSSTEPGSRQRLRSVRTRRYPNVGYEWLRFRELKAYPNPSKLTSGLTSY